MSVNAPARKPVAARKAGYAIAAVVNAALLYLINDRPGWEAAPFLTGDMSRVLALLNLSLTLGRG
jgi:hypothetical protein